MTVKEVTHAYHLQRWAELINDCKSSGKSIASWCSEQGVNTKTYYYWQRRVREKALGQMTACQVQSVKSVPVVGSPAFAEYKLPAQTASSAAVTLHLSFGKLEIHNGAEAGVIENTLMALKSLC